MNSVEHAQKVARLLRIARTRILSAQSILIQLQVNDYTEINFMFEVDIQSMHIQLASISNELSIVEDYIDSQKTENVSLLSAKDFGSPYDKNWTRNAIWQRQKRRAERDTENLKKYVDPE